jgi:hypothetical protein
MKPSPALCVMWPLLGCWPPSDVPKLKPAGHTEARMRVPLRLPSNCCLPVSQKNGRVTRTKRLRA